MKKLIFLLVIVVISAVTVFATDKPDTIYNLKGQAVQAEASNYFETFSDNFNHSIDLTANGGTLFWSLLNPTQSCKVKVTSTSSRTGVTAQTISAGSRDGMARGYGITFVHFSSCSGGEYRSMRGNWAGL